MREAERGRGGGEHPPVRACPIIGVIHLSPILGLYYNKYSLSFTSSAAGDDDPCLLLMLIPFIHFPPMVKKHAFIRSLAS
jgi:hypothetical protein